MSSRKPGRPVADEAIEADRVLMHAVNAFAEQGYEAVSMRRLSSELGMGHTFLSDRYGTKEGLWRAAVEHAVGRAAPLVTDALRTADGDDLSRLVGAIRALHRAAANAAGLALLIDSEAHRDTPRLAHLFELMRPINDELQAVFDRAVASGVIRPMPWYLFYFLVTSPTSLYAQPPLARLLGRPDGASDHELLSDIVLGGLLAPGAPATSHLDHAGHDSRT